MRGLGVKKKPTVHSSVTPFPRVFGLMGEEAILLRVCGEPGHLEADVDSVSARRGLAVLH